MYSDPPPWVVLQAEGSAPPSFSDAERARLHRQRARYRAGTLHEYDLPHCRLEFARWLVQHNRIGEH